MGEVKETDLEHSAIYTNSEGKRFPLNPEAPFNHKWFSGEFHFGPWGADSSPFKGISKNRVRVSMMGKKINPTKRNGIASVYGVITAVLDPEDRDLIGQAGWWKLDDLSRSSASRRRR